MKRLIAVFIAALTVFLFVTSSATAATVVKLDLPRLVANSDVIAVAQVTDLSSELEDDGRVYTTIRFRTDEALKGDPSDEFTIRQVGGRDGDIATVAPGMPDFSEHERVFLFLTDYPDRPVVTGMTQGKFQIATGPDGETDFVIPQTDGGHLIEPGEAPMPPGNTVDDPDHVAPLPDFDTDAHADIFDRVHDFQSFRQRVQQTIDQQRERYQ